MSLKRMHVVGAAAAILLVAAGCSSSSKSTSSPPTTAASSSAGSTSGSAGSTGSSGSGSTKTITVGVLTDITGPGAPSAKGAELGVKAGIGLAAQEGYKIKYIIADTTTSPTGTLAAAQKLVDEDHVYAVIAISALTFAAAPFLASHHVPVIGVAYDGSEWIKTPNMFSTWGYQDYSKVETTLGQSVKMLGGTVVGSIGTGISPSSAEAAKSFAISAQAAGLKVGYVNSNLPYGTTNVEPIALAIKAAGVDAILPSIDTGTSFSLLNALKQQNVSLKVALLATGGGGDLFAGGPAAERNAQGVYFLSPFEPVVMHTAATGQLQNALKTYAGVTTEPTQGEYSGYTSIDALVQGLKAAGVNATQAQFINAMLGIRTYNAAGLYGTHSIGFAMDQRGLAAGADNCTWLTQFVGSDFHLVPGQDPICGTVIPGKTVSP